MSIKHSPRKVTLAMIRGKPITTSVPVIHYHASDDELEEIYPSSEEEKRLTPELDTSDSKVTSTLSKCVERRFAHESDVSENNSDTRSVSTENVLPEGTPPSLDPWKVFSEIKGKITKTFEEKLSEIKNDKKKRRHSKAESSSISDFEDQGFVISCDKKIEGKQLTDETMTTTATTTTTTIIGQHRRGNPVRYVGFSDVKTGLKDKSLQDECVESGIEASEFAQSVNEDVVCCTKNDSSTAKGSSRDNYACLQQQASTRSFAFPKRIDFKATFSHLMQQLIFQTTYKFVAIFIAIFSIYYVALLPEYVLGFIMGIFGTVAFYSALTKFKRLLTTLPDEKFVCSSIVPVLEIPAAEEHSVIERFQGWLNELPYNYEPSNYHVARTKSVFFRLEGNILRVMETRMKIPKKAVWDEAKHKLKFVRRRVYNLTGARIELVPYGLTRRRRWSKKYPICITVKKGALICNVTLKNSANDECAINDYYRKTPAAKVRVKYRSDKKVASSWEEENHEGDEACFIDGEPDESVMKQNRRREENKDAAANDSYSIYDPNNDNVVKSGGSWREQRQKEIDITSRNVRRSDYSCIDRRGKQIGKGANVGMEKNEKEQDGKKEIRKGMKEVGPEEVPRVIQQRKGFPFGKDLNEEECRKGDKEGAKKTVLMADRVGNEEKEAGENDEEEEEKDEEDEEEEEDEDYDELKGKYGELGMGELEEMRDDEDADDDDYDYDYDYDDDDDDNDDDDDVDVDDDDDDDEDDDNMDEDEDEDEDEDKDVVVVVVNDNDNDDNRSHNDNNEIYEVEGKKEKQQEKKKEEEKLTDKDVGKEKIAVGGVEQRNVKKTDRKVADNDDNCDGIGVDKLGKRSDGKVKLLNLKSTLKKSKKKPNQRNELKIFVFARADREKEDWFRRLVSAASLSEKKKRGDSLSFIVDGSYMSNVSLTGQKNAITESKGCLSASSSDEKSTTELNYNAYMGKYLDAGCSSTLEKSCSTGTEDTLWINCLIARLLFDIHKCPETINLIQDKIQRKLSSIKLPYFMECLLVSEVTIGQGAPVIRSITKPMFNERGIWLDFDVTYKGSLTMTVETKLNLMKLTRTGSIPSNNSNVLIPSEKHESIVRSPIFDSDLEDTPETSTEDEDTSRTQLYNTAKETTGTQSSGKKFLSMVDRIAANKYFQHATELSYVRRAMEGVSNTEIRLMVTVSSIEGCLSVNIPPAPADRL